MISHSCVTHGFTFDQGSSLFPNKSAGDLPLSREQRPPASLCFGSSRAISSVHQQSHQQKMLKSFGLGSKPAAAGASSAKPAAAAKAPAASLRGTRRR